MNTTPDSERSGEGPGGPRSGSSFFAWLRSLGIVRGSDRWFAGVAGGIAARAGIDPLIVRGVFVVLALLGGPGLLIYLVGWLLLPDAQGRIHTEDIFRGRAETWVLVTGIVLASVLVIPAIFGLVLTGVPLFGAPSFWGWDVWASLGIPVWLTRTIAWLFWIAVLVLGFIWLRRAVLRRGREQAAGSEARPPAGAGTGAGAGAAPAAPPAAPTPRTAPTTPTAPMPGPAFAAGADGTATEPIGPTAGAASAAAAGTASERAAAGTDPGAPTAENPAGEGSGPKFADQTRAFADRTEEFANRTAQQATDWGQRFGEKANRWGEDVGRQADEWSARYAEHHDAHRLGTGQTILTLALALLAAGLTGLWVLGLDALPVVESVAPAPLIAALIAALAVLALSLIVAGVRGRYTGWVGFLSACGVVALLITVVLPWGTRFQPFGNMHVTGADAPGTVVIAGNATLDLADLDEQAASVAQFGEEPDLEVWLMAGNVRVELPEEYPVVLEVRVLAGNIREDGDDGRRTSGPFLSRTITANLPPGADATDATTATVYLLAGNVRVAETASGSSGNSGNTLLEERQREEAESQRDTADRERAERLEEELSLVEWQLDEPGISPGKRQGLEDQRDRLREELNELEQEMAR